jgi:hypothetical protein
LHTAGRSVDQSNRLRCSVRTNPHTEDVLASNVDDRRD